MYDVDNSVTCLGTVGTGLYVRHACPTTVECVSTARYDHHTIRSAAHASLSLSDALSRSTLRSRPDPLCS
eukprot:6266585-Pyramimonas_sp.AAC.1